MKRIIFLPLAILFMTACAPTHYANDNPNANWERDSNQCDAYALGNTPMPVYQAPQAPQTTYGSGMVYGSDGPINYTYTQTTYQNTMQTSLNNMNNSLAAMSRRQSLYEMCLKNLGWYEVLDSNDIRPKNINKSYEECIKEQAKVLPKQCKYNTPDELTIVLEKICQKRTGGFVKNLASYYAHKEIK